MYNEMMNAMGMTPVYEQPTQGGGPPPGMSMEMWLQLMRMQQMSQERAPNSRPMMMADATNMIRQYGGSTDGLSAQTRAGLKQLEREEAGGQQPTQEAPTVNTYVPPPSMETVNPNAARSRIQQQQEADRAILLERERRRQEEERLRQERYQRAMKVNISSPDY